MFSFFEVEHTKFTTDEKNNTSTDSLIERHLSYKMDIIASYRNSKSVSSNLRSDLVFVLLIEDRKLIFNSI